VELPWGFIDPENFGKLFKSSFVMASLPGIQISDARIQDGWNAAMRSR
jgi:hypothetical protein